MGIEPTRAALPGLENKRFAAMANAKCDWRVNIRGMWGHVGLRRAHPKTAPGRGNPFYSIGLCERPAWRETQLPYRTPVSGGLGS
jgi:hypothetical protein